LRSILELPVVVYALSVVALLGAWQLLGMNMNPIFLSTPLRVGEAFVELTINGEILRALADSAEVFALGYVLSLLGIPIGILMGRHSFVANFLNLYVYVFYSVPYVVFLPLFIVWLGLGFWTKVVMIVFAAIWPLIINTWAGVRDVDRTLVEVARGFRATEAELMRKVVIPAAVPFILTGVKLATGRALVGLIVAELFTAITGLGRILVYYSNFFQMAKVFVPIVILAVVAIALLQGVEALERKFSSWKVKPFERI